jgi:general secretion pathway protein I
MKRANTLRTRFLLQIANCKLQTANLRARWRRVGTNFSQRSALHPSSFIPHPAQKRHKGFSILEVILALAILAGAMTVLGELARMGMRNARMTQDLTRAQLLCESKMAEFTSGITYPQAVTGAVFDTIDQQSDIQWVYSVMTEQIDQYGLIALTVTVSQSLPPEKHPATFTLVRWIPDPNIAATATSTSTQQTGATTSMQQTGATSAGTGGQ